MATGTIKKLISLLPFSLVSICITSLFLMIFSSLFYYFDFDSFISICKDSYIQHVIKFTLWQAFLSTILSIALAIPIARSLHRNPNFLGRSILLKFLNLTFILPSIILVVGIAMIHGKNGLINNMLHGIYNHSFGYYLYGILGVILGHLAFCLPFAVRVFLSRLESVPDEIWRLTHQLNFSSFNIFKLIEWPYLRLSIIGATILIFMMCFSSFVIVLVLGGGPAVTTIELEIYHALRSEFNLSRATNLSFIQFIICSCLILLAQKYNTPFFAAISNISKQFKRPDSKQLLSHIIDMTFILLLFIISILPVIAIIVSGFNNKIISVLYSSEFWNSATESLLISISSGILTLILSLSLISGAFYFRYQLNKSVIIKPIIWLSNIHLMIPAYVFITGILIAIYNFITITDISIYLIIIVNSIAALPFVTNILLPISIDFTSQEMNLCKILGINKWSFIKQVYWPKIRKSFSYALALSVTMSWGDLNLIALLGSNQFSTLPYLLYNMMSTYRIEEAAVVALMILISSFLLFWIIEEFLSGEEDVKY